MQNFCSQAWMERDARSRAPSTRAVAPARGSWTRKASDWLGRVGGRSSGRGDGLCSHRKIVHEHRSQPACCTCVCSRVCLARHGRSRCEQAAADGLLRPDRLRVQNRAPTRSARSICPRSITRRRSKDRQRVCIPGNRRSFEAPCDGEKARRQCPPPGCRGWRLVSPASRPGADFGSEASAQVQEAGSGSHGYSPSYGFAWSRNIGRVAVWSRSKGKTRTNVRTECGGRFAGLRGRIGTG